jgi:pimeloyl-ACP methyl ester carboxylesterase
MNQLGPDAFTFAGKGFERIDWTLMTERGYNIQVSQWGQQTQADDRPILIYLHGNASARLEVLPQLTGLLAMGLTVVSLDFAGSGKSDGDYVSLGYYEREDLATVVAHLRRHHKHNKNLKIALWGRSMGASTAIMYGARDSRVDCMILDSSFASLVKLAEELVETARQQGIVVPNVVVSAALQMIQWSVQKNAKFNIRDLSPVTYASDCESIPALFIHGEHDDFIKQHHSQDICEEYKGPKHLLVVEGDHNDPRPPTCISSCQSFLHRHLNVSEDWHLLDIKTLENPTYPPWFQKSVNNASSGFDDKTMGMTQQRQQEIKSSITTMLGGQGTTAGEEEGTEKNSVEVELPLSVANDDDDNQ